MKPGNAYYLIAPLAAFLFLSPFPAQASAEVKATFLYSLSNFSGTVPYSWVRQSIDPERGEIYVVTGDSVAVYNSSGMEVYRFGDDLDIGGFMDVSVESNGDILILSLVGDRFRVTRCNYRGEPRAEIKFRNLPDEFAGISPGRLFSRNGKLYIADLFAKMVVVTDATGVFREGYDIAPLLASSEEKPGAEYDIASITVDGEGNLFFTVPALFKVFKLSPDRELSSFGSAGNLPGKFNIVSGIATDDRGYIFVTDSLRSAVSVFDKGFKFQAQFSRRGTGPGDLISPSELMVDKAGRVYVSQARKRGVSVFGVAFE
jgi:DNA-binding beta-propeller fold protein YncE